MKRHQHSRSHPGGCGYGLDCRICRSQSLLNRPASNEQLGGIHGTGTEILTNPCASPAAGNRLNWGRTVAIASCFRGPQPSIAIGFCQFDLIGRRSRAKGIDAAIDTYAATCAVDRHHRPAPLRPKEPTFGAFSGNILRTQRSAGDWLPCPIGYSWLGAVGDHRRSIVISIDINRSITSDHPQSPIHLNWICIDHRQAPLLRVNSSIPRGDRCR
jgi:hypothetical protein